MTVSADNTPETTAQRLLNEFLGSEDIGGLYVTLTRDEMLQAILDAVRAGQAL